MKKLLIFLVLLVFLALIVVLRNNQARHSSINPDLFGSPFAGGPGAGYASGMGSGRLDGSDVKH